MAGVWKNFVNHDEWSSRAICCVFAFCHYQLALVRRREERGIYSSSDVFHRSPCTGERAKSNICTRPPASTMNYPSFCYAGNDYSVRACRWYVWGRYEKNVFDIFIVFVLQQRSLRHRARYFLATTWRTIRWPIASKCSWIISTKTAKKIYTTFSSK